VSRLSETRTRTRPVSAGLRRPLGTPEINSLAERLPMRKHFPAFLLLAAAVGCGGVRSAPLTAPDAIDRLPHVETVQPEVIPSLAVRFEVTALVEAMEKADLCARVPGVVESLQLDPKRPEVDIGRR